MAFLRYSRRLLEARCKGYPSNPLELYVGSFYLFFGLLIRVRNYLADISFWNDEAALALNLLRLNFHEFFSPLNLNQVAPIGFLVSEKLLLSIGGNNELSLRFIALVAGCAAPILAFIFVRRALGPLVAILCLAQLSVIKEPIFYANDLKPYASDLAIAIGLMALAWKEKLPSCSSKHYYILSLCGIISIWFSFPAVFVLSSIALVYWIYLISDRQWHKIGPVSAMSGAWLLAFGIQYILLGSQTQNPSLAQFWGPYFLTFPPVSLEDLTKYFSVFYRAFRNPLWTFWPPVSILLFVGGCVLMWINHRKLLLMVLIPLILNLIAASLHKYPFGDRLLEYGVLNLYLPIAFFLAWMVKGNSKIRWVRIVAMILIVGNLAEPTINAADKLIFPRKYEQMKQVVLYVRAHMVESDTIFVHYPAYTTFSYYRERFQLNSGNIHRLGWRPTPSDFRSLSGRGWLVFGHAKEYRGTDYEALFVSEARTEGKMIDKYIDIGASAYLFSFHDARGGNKTYPLIPRKVAAK